MTTTNLVLWIRQEYPKIFEILIQDLHTNLGVSHYRRFSDEELHARCLAIYDRLCLWLEHEDVTAVRKPAIELGQERYQDNIPLGQLVLGILLLEKHLWLHMEEKLELSVVDADIRQRVIEYFQKSIYWAARGYEEALDKASVGRMNEPPRSTVRPRVEHKSESEEVMEQMEATRGGQVGEFGG